MKRLATLAVLSLLLTACAGLRPGGQAPSAPESTEPLPPSEQPQPTPTPTPQPQPAMTSLSGTATFTSSDPVPPTAKLTVSLYDAERGDTPAGRLAQRTLFVKGGGVVPFRLDYAPARATGGRYLLSGRILLGGRPLFLTAEPVAVDLGSGAEVELPLQPVR